ncbi:MAG: ABC transporter substrate-binding protein [Rhodospirillales bacterium]|nr:ABC transporter substrate-binding protein [Rhodospirillales bacterium]
MTYLGKLRTAVTAALLAAAALPLVQPPAAKAEELIRCAYPYWFGFAPVPVAMGMGYFKEEGLEVTTVFDNDRANVLPGLEIGDLDCTMRTIGEHMSRPLAADSDLVVIGVIDVSVGADGVVAGPDINAVTDLVGKTFAGEINHPGTIMTAHALKQAGYDFNKDVNVRLIATDDGQAVFEDPEVAAVATWEPMLSEIVANTSRKGSKILLSSKDFNGLITDVIIVNKSDYEANREKYAAFMRGIYRAVDLYNKDPAKFLEVAAPTYDVTPDQMKADLGGVYYTSYEDALEFFGIGQSPKLKEVIEGLNAINVDLDLMDKAIAYEAIVDPTLTEGLFEGKTR